MTSKQAVIPVQIGDKTFKRFAWYDTLILRKRWLSPFLFSTIFICFAAVCFALRDNAQSALLGYVLLGVALVLPAVYFLHYALQLRDQVKRMGLKTPKAVYTLTLTEQAVLIHNDMKEEPDVTLPWENVLGVWKNGGEIYIYANAARAFILPIAQADCPEETLRGLITAGMDASRVHL